MTFPVGSRTPPRNPETASGPTVKRPVTGFQTPTLRALKGGRTTSPEGHTTEPQYPVGPELWIVAPPPPNTP